MSKQLILFILVSCLAHTTIAADGKNNLWHQANSFYEAKQYDSAVHYYLKIDRQSGSASVNYNLGNSYYRLNNIGKAILHYERALKYDPSDSRIADNLYLANGRINNRIQGVPQIFFVRWWNTITKSTNSNAYAIVAIILFLILIAYQLLKRAEKIKTELPIQASIATIVITVLLVILSVISGQRMVQSGTAVVIKDESPFMSSPKFGKSQSLIPAGTKITLSKEQKVWVEVVLPDGRIGWLQSTDIEKI